MTSIDPRRGIVVCSGGIDSTVLLYMLASMGKAAHVVFFDYGQASASAQWDLVDYHVQVVNSSDLRLRTGVLAATRVKLPVPTRTGGVYEHGFKPTKPDDALGFLPGNEEPDRAWLKQQWSFIESRNALFLIYAAGMAAEMDLASVYVGFQEEIDDSACRDDSDVAQPFVDACNAVLAYGAVSRFVKIQAPWLDMRMSKRQIVEYGLTLPAVGDRTWLETFTHSCEFWPACGVCGACARRAEGLR